MEQWHYDALEVVRNTRDISLPGFGCAAITHDKGREQTDVVTEVDHKIEESLKTELAKLDPTITFVGEEFGGDRAAQKYWISDPIDGTGLYVRGLPHCSTMLALVENDEVQFGVIYDFANDSAYYAARGQGAFQDGEPMQVSNRTITHDRVYIGYEMRADNPENEPIKHELLSRCAPIKYLCAGYEYVYVANGKLDARVCSDPYGFDYDFAAGCLLVSEAGGVAAQMDGQPYRPSVRPHIVANPAIYKELTEGPNALFPLTK